MNTPITFTLGFAGHDSVWFTPMLAHPDSKIDDELFSQARRARDMAQALLSCGCAMAARARPELSESLAALAQSPLSLDFFDYSDTACGLGWFRLQATPQPGSTPAALEACETALAESHAPVLCSKAPGPLFNFINGASDEVPLAFRQEAQAATARVAGHFNEFGGAVLSHADIVVLASADGSKRLAVCVPSASAPGDSLSDLKTFVKLAQAGMEARRAADGATESPAFFDAMDKALGAQPDSPAPRRSLLSVAPGAFFAMPASTRVVMIEGLPSPGFEDMSKLFMQSVAKRFGPLVARESPAALFPHQGAPLGHPEQASLASLFSRLPPLQSRAPATPTPPAPPTATRAPAI